MAEWIIETFTTHKYSELSLVEVTLIEGQAIIMFMLVLVLLFK